MDELRRKALEKLRVLLDLNMIRFPNDFIKHQDLENFNIMYFDEARHPKMGELPRHAWAAILSPNYMITYFNSYGKRRDLVFYWPSIEELIKSTQV